MNRTGQGSSSLPARAADGKGSIKMGNDVRSRYTKSLIKETFFKLLKDKPVRQITVKEICEISEINRSTFYKYFLDVYDVMDQIEDDIEQVMLARMDECSGREFLVIILREIKEHQEEYASIIRQIGDLDFLYRIANACFLKLRSNSAEKKDAVHEFMSDPRSYAYFAGGIGGVMGYWVGSGMKESPEEIADLIEKYSESLWN